MDSRMFTNVMLCSIAVSGIMVTQYLSRIAELCGP